MRRCCWYWVWLLYSDVTFESEHTVSRVQRQSLHLHYMQSLRLCELDSECGALMERKRLLPWFALLRTANKVNFASSCRDQYKRKWEPAQFGYPDWQRKNSTWEHTLDNHFKLPLLSPLEEYTSPLIPYNFHHNYLLFFNCFQMAGAIEKQVYSKLCPVCKILLLE